jgi:hypothetical protein
MNCSKTRDPSRPTMRWAASVASGESPCTPIRPRVARWSRGEYGGALTLYLPHGTGNLSWPPSNPPRRRWRVPPWLRRRSYLWERGTRPHRCCPRARPVSKLQQEGQTRLNNLKGRLTWPMGPRRQRVNKWGAPWWHYPVDPADSCRNAEDGGQFAGPGNQCVRARGARGVAGHAGHMSAP